MCLKLCSISILKQSFVFLFEQKFILLIAVLDEIMEHNVFGIDTSVVWGKIVIIVN